MRDRDGGVFTAGSVCPRCGAGDVHRMRAPNPAPPTVVRPGTGEVATVRSFATGGVIGTITDRDLHDRWDERPFEVVRTCTGCGWEWGQR